MATQHCKSTNLASPKRCKANHINHFNIFYLRVLFRRYRGAYHHFSRAVSSQVRDELLKEEKDHSMGAVTTTVSIKVRAFNFNKKSTVF